MKLAAKHTALSKARNKKANLERQIEVFKNSLANVSIDIEKSEEDLVAMQALFAELETLEKSNAANSKEMSALLEGFDLEDPSQAYKRTDGYKRFEELNAASSKASERIKEIPKEINKVYYRR